jgi:hypothetical protein
MHKKKPQNNTINYFSGPEPQRGLLEHPKTELKRYRGDVVFIKGIVEKEQKRNN